MTRSPIILGLLGTVLVASSLAACGTFARDGSEGAEGLSSADSTDVGIGDGGTDASADGAARDGAAPDGAAPDGGAVVQVLLKSMSFDPPDVTIHPGDTIHWVWNKGRHNVISGPVNGGAGVPDNKFCNPGAASCANAPLQAPPYTWDHTFHEVGDYPYYCAPHVAMGMVGTIHVVP